MTIILKILQLGSVVFFVGSVAAGIIVTAVLAYEAIRMRNVESI